MSQQVKGSWPLKWKSKKKADDASVSEYSQSEQDSLADSQSQSQSQSMSQSQSNYGNEDGESEALSEIPRDQALRLIVTSDGEIDPSLLVRKRGWVFKKGGSAHDTGFGRRNWKKRWFRLNPIDFYENTGYELQQYDAGKNETLKGTVSLVDVEIFCTAVREIRVYMYKIYFIIL